MKTLLRSAVALVVAGGLATPVMAAATTPMKDQTPTSANADQTGKQTNVRQRLANDLTKAGFTGIKIMPESFLIRAKDSSGNPVMMVVNPDSITAVSEVVASKSAKSASNATNASGQKVLSGAQANGDPTPPAKQ